VDTDVLIDLAKGNEGVLRYLESLPDSWSISTMTAMEIVVGARDKHELAKIDEFLAALPKIRLSTEIGEKAYGFLVAWSRSHGLRIFDALIAATAIVSNRTLVTRNRKHFRMIPDLMLKVPEYGTALP